MSCLGRKSEDPKRFSTKELAEHFCMTEKTLSVQRISKVSPSYHGAIPCYKMVYDGKKKATLQTSCDTFSERLEKKHDDQMTKAEHEELGESISTASLSKLPFQEKATQQRVMYCRLAVSTFFMFHS